MGISSEAGGAAAADAAARDALVMASLPRAEAALLFATASYGGSLPTMLEAAIAVLGTEAVVGATAHGVMGAGRHMNPPFHSKTAANEAATGFDMYGRRRR